MSDAPDQQGKKKSSRVDALQAEVAELREQIQRSRDGQRMGFGALIGIAGLLIVVAWSGGQKTYEFDKAEFKAELTRENEQRYQEFVKRLAAEEPAQERKIDEKIAGKWRELLARVNNLSGNSNTNLQQLKEDVDNKIRLMFLARDQKYGDAFGYMYLSRAIPAVNNKAYAEATEHFLSAAMAFWMSNREAEFQTCLARLNDICFKALNRRMLIAHPTIEEKFAMLLIAMEKGNTGGRWQVAINDLRQGWARVQQRP